MNVQAKIKSADEVSDAMASTLVAIGQRIRKARLTRSMTLQALAVASGISTSMLSLVERGRVTPSLGSLILVADSLGVPMSDLIVDEPAKREEVVVHSTDRRVVEHAKHLVRRLLRDDRRRGVSIAISEFPPNSDTTPTPHAHGGYEYGFVLEGKLTVEVDGVSYNIEKGDLISYSSRCRHRIWNPGKRNARTLWFNLNKAP
jgi:transcriptional regulator with XRE-family HTH domain